MPSCGRPPRPSASSSEPWPARSGRPRASGSPSSSGTETPAGRESRKHLNGRRSNCRPHQPLLASAGGQRSARSAGGGHVSQDDAPRPLSPEELAAETGAALPDKEVISLLDLNADLDIALDAAAPIDLAVAANANVAAPIDAAVGANVLSSGSTAQALADQGVLIDQGITGEAVATAPQDSTIDQSDDAVGDAEPAPSPTDGGVTETVG